jgi:hypothetical protein
MSMSTWSLKVSNHINGRLIHREVIREAQNFCTESDYRGDNCDVEDLSCITCEKYSAKTSLYSCLANAISRARDRACYAGTIIFNPFRTIIPFQ